MMPAADFLLQSLHFWREKFNGSAAGSAHHVVMIAAIVLMLEPRHVVMKRHFAGQSTFRQEL